ncbi:MAG: hypothetical protein GY729_08030 [Desulfobacteraceae bacterium]|nr:hypothetical protein [Desulfobacteraceae bacterium]
MEPLIARKEGWNQRGVYDDPKLTEIAKMYKELGFEVKIKSFKPEHVPGCRECMKSSGDKFKVLFTKKIGS